MENGKLKVQSSKSTRRSISKRMAYCRRSNFGLDLIDPIDPRKDPRFGHLLNES